MVEIKTIIFDLSEVYLQGLKGVEFEIARVLDLNKDDVKNVILRGEKTQQLFRGEMSEEQYWNGIISENNFPRKVDGYGSTADFLKVAVRENLKEIPGTRSIIEKLNVIKNSNGEKKYQLVLLSDHAREWAEHCKQNYHLQELFPIMQWSFEEGLTKKSPETYSRVLKKAKADAKTTLFIDDNKSNLYVACSSDVGIKYTCQFDNPGSLEFDLSALGCFKCAPYSSFLY